MKRREFLRNAAIVAATSSIPSEIMATETSAAAASLSPSGEAGRTDAPLIDSEPVLQNYAETSIGIAFSVSDWANGYVIYGEKADLSDGRKVWCGGFRLTDMENEVMRVRLTGLRPSTLYYYKIGADRIDYRGGYNIHITGHEERERIYSFRTAGSEAKSHFCVVNDTHAAWDAFAPAIDKVMALQPSCVVWNGDACNTEESIEALKRIFFKPEIARKDYAASIPYLFCPGNHDLRGMANRHPERVWMFRQPEERAPRDWDLGRNFAVRMGDIALVGLDTGEDKLDTNPKFCGLFVSEPYRRAQQLWLRDALQRPEIKSAPYLVAFCHIPLYDAKPSRNPGDVYPDDKDKKYSTDFAMWQRTCGKLWGPLLDEAGCHVLIAAHQHCYRMDMPNDEHAWMQIIGGGPDMSGKNSKNFPTVIEGKVTDGKLVVTVHNLYSGQICSTTTFSNPRR